jgi:hypothetical protein
MVGDLGKGMANSLFDLLEHKPPQAAKLWKELPGWYLQYLYGWKPLMDDITNSVGRLVDYDLALDVFHLKLRGKWKGRGEYITPDFPAFTSAGQWTLRSRLTLEQINRCVLRYDVPNDRLAGLQPLGFFGGLWEGAPYSFVLDWIAPIGDWLTALDANSLGIYFKEGTSSEIVKVLDVVTEDRSQELAPPGYTQYAMNYQVTLERSPWNFVRTLETPWSITSRVPFRADLNLQHAAQGLSLLAVAMKALGG